MGGIDRHGRAPFFHKKGTRRVDDGVVQVTPRGAVAVGSVHVLDDGAAERDIDELHPLADAEDGDAGAQAQLQRLELQDIQLGVDVHGAAIAFPEKGGRDIAAARQQEPVAGNHLAGVQRRQGRVAVIAQEADVVIGRAGASEDSNTFERGHNVSLQKWYLWK